MGTRTLLALVLALWPLAAEAGKSQPTPIPLGLQYFGPDEVTVDLLRPGADPGDRVRIFVQATLPDGSTGVFMIDTGAAISVLDADVAERIGLTFEDGAFDSVQGLGGTTRVNYARLPVLQIGGASVPDVDVAVGVAGVMTSWGTLPLAGILGNNVWDRFVMEVDYPADTLVLHRPGTFKMPKKSAPMRFIDNEVQTIVGIETRTVPQREGALAVQVDTGASGLMLTGGDVLPFPATPDVYTSGLEPVLGIGAADTMPTSAFFKPTRRVPIATVEIGGRKVKTQVFDPQFEARWINFDTGPKIGPQSMLPLVGHELLADYDLIIDYQGGKIALAKSKRKPRQIDAHEVLLAQDIAQYGDDPSRALFRAKMKIGMRDEEAAEALLVDYLEKVPEADDRAEAQVLLAAVRRFEGDLDGAWEAIKSLSAADLVAEGEIGAVVNGLLLEGKNDEALKLADDAIAQYGDTPDTSENPADWDTMAAADAHIARADALLADHEADTANEEVLAAARLLDNPDAHLLRRARIALARGDRNGALAHIRRLLQLYPSNGQYLWFYATLVDRDSAAKDTFRIDMDDAMGRLHPEDLPFDYLVMAWHLMGDAGTAQTYMDKGIARDCARIEREADRDNCYAWYWAMAGIEPDASLESIDRALELEGDRSDYLDTKAMVLLARGEYQPAYEAAMAAARLSPDDMYMLWQAERIGQLADEHRAN